jgi:hypothetical protein
MENNKCVFVEKAISMLSVAGLDSSVFDQYASLDRVTFLNKLNVDLAATGDRSIDQMRAYFSTSEPASNQLSAIQKRAVRVVKYLNRLKG